MTIREAATHRGFNWSWMTFSIVISAVLAIPTGAMAVDFCVSDLTELESAISTAVSNLEADTIMVQEGVYLTTTSLYFTVSSTLDITMIGGYGPGCSVRRFDPSTTILDGQGTHQVVRAYMLSDQFWFEGFTVRNGSSTGFGGGMVVGVSAGATVDVVIRHNIFHSNSASNQGGGIMGGSDLGTFELTNNLFYDNTAPLVSAVSLTCNGASDVLIINNTVSGNTGTTYGGLRLGGAAPSVFANNIFYGNSDADLVLAGGPSSLENNCYQQLSGVPTSSSGNTTDDPLFIGNGNYRLQTISTVIDAGTDTPSNGTIPDHDLDGALRPYGAAIDMGAYENSTIFADGFESSDTGSWTTTIS